MATMRAARLHEVGGAFTIDEVDRPTPGEQDVIIRVEAANIVPNLRNVISTYPVDKPFLPLPELPAIFGMDTAGVITQVGSRVRNLRPGERVYLNPGRDSGDSWESRNGRPMNDPAYTFQGYFGFGPGSRHIHRDYPHGALCQYVKAPASGSVVIPENVPLAAAARFGYLGTSYSALRKGDVRGGSSVLIHGAASTLGDGAVFLDATGPTATADVTMAGIWALRRGGRMVSIGAMPEILPLPMYRLMTLHISIHGSLWFTVAEGEDMARMAGAGTLDLSRLEGAGKKKKQKKQKR